MQQSEILQKALGYLNVGFSIVPQSRDKKPLVKWEEFQKRQPTAEEVIGWWEKFPEANIAIVTGKISGLTVVDVEHGGDISKLPKTLTIKSGGGGHHFYYKYHPMSSYNRVSDLTDIKSDGGLITAPPSIHASGMKYETIEKMQPVDFPVHLFEKPIETKKTNKDLSKIISDFIPKGERNESMTAVAGKMLRNFREEEWEDMVWPSLVAINETHGNPPLPERELRNIYNSIAKTEERRRMTGDDVGEAQLIERDTDRFVIHAPITDGFVVFEFDDIESSSRSVDVRVRCSVEVPGRVSKAFVQRMNILSASAREGFARQLKESFSGTKSWPLVVSQACEILESAVKKQLEGQDFVEQAFTDTEYLLRPFIEDKAINILFGEGGTGKTYISLRMGLSIALGYNFLGSEPLKQTNVLFIDYENNYNTWASRTTKLLNGIAGLMPQDREIARERLIYFNAGGLPLYDIKYDIMAMIRKRNVGLVIVDSAALACGAEPEQADVANKLINALNKLGVAVLLIAHETKNTDNKKKTPFGSVFFYNGARNIWNVDNNQEQDDNVIHVGLFHRKSNNERKSSPKSARVYFGDNMVDINQEDTGRWIKELSLKDNILRTLSEDEMSLDALVEEIGKDRNQIKVRLVELKNKGLVDSPRQGFWCLKNKEIGKA